MKKKIKSSERFFVKIIRDICKELNITIESFSKDWILKLSKNSQVKYIIGYNFPLNSAISKMIADDKNASYEILQSADIPCIPNILLFNIKNWQKISQYFESNNSNVVCKPNNGTGGRDVYKITNQEKLKDTIKHLLQKNRSVIISPFYHIKKEYRVIMLNGNTELIYQKNIPTIIGDGTSSIKELLTKNSITNQTKFQEIDLKKIPEKGDEIPINWKSNLSEGSTPQEINSDHPLYNKLSNQAKKVTETINIDFASIDIIEGLEGKLSVLEINSGVMTEFFLRHYPKKYTKIKNIYRKAMVSIFKEKRED